MPWKDRYTISDEIGIADEAVHWPDDNRCAATIVVSLSVATEPQGIEARHLSGDTAFFAMNGGFERLFDTLARRGLRVTVAVPAIVAEAAPDKIRALASAGHEIAALGLRHEDVSELEPGEESERLSRTTEILTEVTGTRPLGWYALPRQMDAFATGTISPNTVGLLREHGYRYFGNGLADDAPHYWVSDFEKRHAILTMPYYYHFDDQYFCFFPFRGSGLENTDMLARNWRTELDAQYARGRFFTMVVHPQHSGWSNRLEELTAFLDHLVSLPRLWTAPAGAVADYWLEAFSLEDTLDLAPSIWTDYPDSQS